MYLTYFVAIVTENAAKIELIREIAILNYFEDGRSNLQELAQINKKHAMCPEFKFSVKSHKPNQKWSLFYFAYFGDHYGDHSNGKNSNFYTCAIDFFKN